MTKTAVLSNQQVHVRSHRKLSDILLSFLRRIVRALYNYLCDFGRRADKNEVTISEIISIMAVGGLLALISIKIGLL